MGVFFFLLLLLSRPFVLKPNFLEQFQVHSKVERAGERSHTPPRPTLRPRPRTSPQRRRSSGRALGLHPVGVGEGVRTRVHRGRVFSVPIPAPRHRVGSPTRRHPVRTSAGRDVWPPLGVPVHALHPCPWTRGQPRGRGPAPAPAGWRGRRLRVLRRRPRWAAQAEAGRGERWPWPGPEPLRPAVPAASSPHALSAPWTCNYPRLQPVWAEFLSQAIRADEPGQGHRGTIQAGCWGHLGGWCSVAVRFSRELV